MDRDDYREVYENVWCYLCKGTGIYGVMDMAGIKKIKGCTKCKGKGRLRVLIGSKNWEKGKRVTYSLGTRWRR